MGMGQRKTSAKPFKQKIDLAVKEDIETPDLYSEKVVETENTYDCIREPENALVKMGDKAKLVSTGERIDVYIRAERVGYVVSSDSRILQERIDLNLRNERKTWVQVIDVSELGPLFTIRLER
jgi:hypothetical protein